MDINRFTKKAMEALNNAQIAASTHNNSEILPEHIAAADRQVSALSATRPWRRVVDRSRPARQSLSVPSGTGVRP